MERTDVAVVGGGPAGSSAARAAAEAGADVVLFEKGVPRADREGLGPDSTDAAGMLDYWVDIMGIDVADLPDDVVLQELDRAEFAGPNERITLKSTGIESTYPKFGYTFDRARFDDWLRAEAEAAGAEYRVGVGVRGVASEKRNGTYRHTLELRDGNDVEADALVLADGPQRQVTMGALDQFLPADTPVSETLSPPRVNHIAYQEHRRFPEEVFDPASLQFWWGWMPGETAYPWVFPNDDNVARVGLTMPIGLDLDDVEDREAYRLLRPEDERVPAGAEYVRRLLEELYGDEYDVASEFPVVTDRGKSKGTETYAISSTRPIDSPVGANVAVVGGAMGATSAFHEGGDHVAVRTGTIAGRLAAEGNLAAYNDAWKAAIGDEVLRNVSIADVVGDYTPEQWDETIRIARELTEGGSWSLSRRRAASVSGGLKLYLAYKRTKYRYRDGRYVQVAADDYVV